MLEILHQKVGSFYHCMTGKSLSYHMITPRSEHRNEKNPHKTTLDDFFLAITNHTPLPKVDCCNLSQLFNEYITSFRICFFFQKKSTASSHNHGISMVQWKMGVYIYLQYIRFPQRGFNPKLPTVVSPPPPPCCFPVVQRSDGGGMNVGHRGLRGLRASGADDLRISVAVRLCQ